MQFYFGLTSLFQYSTTIQENRPLPKYHSHMAEYQFQNKILKSIKKNYGNYVFNASIKIMTGVNYD